MNPEALAGALSRWGIAPARTRPDLEIAGTPERAVSRIVIEDDAGALFVVERLDQAGFDRKREIARALEALSADLPEVSPCLPAGGGEAVVRTEAGLIQVSRFVPGIPLPRPEYLDQAWRGPAMADFLVRLRQSKAARRLASAGPAFSPSAFAHRLAARLEEREPALLERLQPALDRLEAGLFAREEALPTAFAHGDFHPLNIVWSETGLAAVIDWEFCGRKPELHDAAVLIGCLGMEHPRALGQEIVIDAVGRLRGSGAFAESSWADFLDLVLALRLAWLSDWLRRRDAEMIDLEAVYIDLLLRKREVLARSWGL